MPSIPPRYHRIHRVVVTAAVAPHTMSLSCRKKLAYIYQAKVKKNDSHYHCIWGKFEPPTVARGRVFMYPSNICGEVLVLSEKLHSVTSQFDQLRAVRFRDAINRVTPRRKLKQNRPSAAESSTSGNIEARELNNSEVTKNVEAKPVRFQQQQLDDETRALQLELDSMLDAVQETESKMVEMSTLNHLMSTHVLQQAQQIEHLYEQAVEATTNVKLGNKELSQAIQRNSSSRTFLLLFLFVLTFSVLFLDWYS